MKKTRFLLIFCLTAILLLLGSSYPALAQGEIYGLVERSGGTTPPDSSLMFIGFVDSTDNEIHLSGSVGAGYDGGHWFDSFQNYLFAPVGTPFTYHFFDTMALETASLDALISSGDGFQEHNITLSPGLWPDPPREVELAREIGGGILLTWLPDLPSTTHIYRRVLPSEGSFFRMDDPGGQLLGSGISTGSFHDTTTEYATGYTYLLLNVDQAGEFSLPLAVHTAPASCCGLFTGGYPGNTTGGADGKRNLADITRLVDRVYLSRNLLWCESDGNTNGDLEQKLNLADITRLVDLVYLSKTELGPCLP